ncbi:SDR family oxidoreductase [Comamonas endophytica]|uniref:SDR family oxidoreductase n=1 Tax=Comamonas endophytica TaxID=2949090 RepID=A0ABY6GC50_9BURK|nr:MULTISPECIES: SDR family oxidoreductase [unclassified Acidovorax]MCD2512997.1 SDR family oxidoreductase [Acidovorax sp. D4N7]UYG52662.1 SDR family oxidoreductase [Acidovorax sp. 5MLIR]
MKVLVTGATGAIGSALVRALRAAHCEVVAASRAPADPAGLPVDLAAVPSRQWWAQQLQGVQVVVNAAGIIRESAGQSFDAVHTRGPQELFHGCVAAGVRHVIQISALGADEGAASAFHRSKKAADDLLRGLPVASTIVQPSLVYGPGVASAALFDSLATLPWLMLPRGGASAVQPVRLEDVVQGLVKLVTQPAAGQRTLAFVGPEPLTLREYLGQLRERQGISTRQRIFSLPDGLALWGARLLEWWPRTPMTREAVGMLLRGNAASATGFAQLLGHAPQPPGRGQGPGEARAHRHAAMLALWLPPMRLAVALLWIWTGLVSLGLYPEHASLALLAGVGLTGVLAWWSLYVAAVLDLALGVAVFFTRGQARRWVWLAQLATMLGYTAILSLRAPEWWLHPFGPLSKNLPFALLIGLLWAFEPPLRHNRR